MSAIPYLHVLHMQMKGLLSGADPGGVRRVALGAQYSRQIFPQKIFFASIFNRMENGKFKQ